jgi:histidine triad (HIT) family protein
LFCDIVKKKIPADIVYESDTVLGFKDISPQAPVHILVIPKEHTESIVTMDPQQAQMNDVLKAIQEITTNLGLDENGFRVVTNCGSWGGQTVHHVHFHILGGRPLSWPPG